MATQTHKSELTIKEAHEYLHENGVTWTEVWLRLQCGRGTIESTKKFNSRIIKRSELDRIIKEHKGKP